MFGTLRTFLALMVVIAHLGGILRLGAYAVFGFYCLSGYLMTFIMHRTYGYTPKGISRYAVNRFLRIYPIYWISILFTAVLIWYFGGDFTSQYHQAIYFPENLMVFFKNVLLFFPYRSLPRLTPPAWALTVEIFFYILIGLGVSKNKRITATWLILSIIYHITGAILQVSWKFRYATIPAASLPFATGALIFHYRRVWIRYITPLAGKAYRYLPFILGFAILANWGSGFLTGRLTGIYFYSNYVLCAVMVVVLSDREELPGINRKFDKWMGDFSYPIYLIHYQIGMVLIAVLATAGIELKRPDPMLLFVSIPVIFFCAWIVTVTLERPIELIRSKIKNQQLR